MVLFDSTGVIRRYETAEDILRDFFQLRMAYYGKRRLALIQASNLYFSSLIQGHLCHEPNAASALQSCSSIALP